MLFLGSITVIGTIVYQVMVENGSVNHTVLDITNAIWGGLIVSFFSLKLTFIFVSFLIFFNNKEEKEEKVVTPKLKENDNF
ncbi:hypothetical protein GCM10010954_23980 [Halobacillus andaensis]|uniref:Uncharacterized protein n=1 Tax=Halobacillus andaensis TaxID=1176239 RepID=A0A917B818_HALAA|nr:hypothetical protein GCM10010954_23980 [Halobacillus andaensis]